MKFLSLLALCCLLASPGANAMELSLAADYWDYDVTGTVDRNGDIQDLDTDLGVEARENLAYRLAWNTGPGWWKPDLAASFTRIDAGGERVTQGARFGPVILVPGGVARGDARLDDIDLTLRYPLQAGSARLWAGLTLKRISGQVVVRDPSDSEEDRQDIDQAFPLLHLAGSLPLASWISLGAQANFARYQDNEAYEVRAGANLGLLGPLGINLGWQTKHYRVSDGDYLLDATLSGAIAGVYLTLR